MSEWQANISGIIKSSVIDGPGNRMVIFFQSCNLNCMYCHNSHTIGVCNLCGICVDACPTNSLQIDGENQRMIFNRESCCHCDTCIKVCPESSNPHYQKLSVSDLIAEITKLKDFISGITVSGGEVMLHSHFLQHFFEAIKSNPELQNLSVLVDSNGNVEQKEWERILPLTDGFMLDIKAFSPEIHQKITGYSNEKILNSIRYLSANRKLSELRLVLVPGYNDNDLEIQKIIHFINSLPTTTHVLLIKMRNHGIRKQYDFLSEPTLDQMKKVQKRFEESGIQVQVV